MASVIGKLHEFRAEDEGISAYIERAELYFEVNVMSNTKGTKLPQKQTKMTCSKKNSAFIFNTPLTSSVKVMLHGTIFNAIVA